jgi:fumarate hydratase class I
MIELTFPLSDAAVRDLKVGDPVSLHGLMVTGRDAAHKWLIDTFVRKTRPPQGDDLQAIEALKPLLAGGAIYHCGPVVAGLDTKQYKFVAAGPTTSIREEPYQAEVLQHFGMRAVIGKGGMGARTLAGCQSIPAVYLHAIGGAATLIAKTVTRVVGVPEALWVIEVKAFPAVVTMDSHGHSLHAEVEAQSQAALDRLLKA